MKVRVLATGVALVILAGCSDLSNESSSEQQSGFTPFSLDLSSWKPDRDEKERLPDGVGESDVQSMSEIQLVRANSDAMNGYADIVLEVDANQSVVSLIYVPQGGAHSTYTLAALETGVVLYHRSNQDVLKLRFENFDPNSGGRLVLTYLYNAITGSTHDFNMDLYKSDSWSLETSDTHHPFTSMFLHAHKLFGQVIGISNVTVE